MTARPDRSLGVFETMLALDGRPIELGAHLARLARSVETLFGATLPAAAEELSLEAARGLACGRLRLKARPGPAEVCCQSCGEEIDPAEMFPAWERGVRLRTHLSQGGLGAHKWIDRSTLPELAAETPLLVDDDGEVLEAGWGNVFAVHDGALFTARADGRILPGITRAATISAARQAGIAVVERALREEDLLSADEVFLTASVRGIVPVRALDGEAIPAGRLSRLLGDRLLRRWRHGSGAAPARALVGES